MKRRLFFPALLLGLLTAGMIVVTARTRAAGLRQMHGVPFAENKEDLAMLGQGDSFEDIFDLIRVRASSALAPQGASSYDAERAHDSNLATAWAPAANRRDGVGAYLEFSLRLNPQTEPDPSLRGMVIFNGYRKSRALWEANNRVKQLRVTMNGKPYGVITLADAYTNQRVDLGIIPLLPHSQINTIRFTILSVYRGTKFHDTPISEIQFEGNGIY